MPVIYYALGLFGFVAFMLLVLWYTTVLSNTKKRQSQ